LDLNIRENPVDLGTFMGVIYLHFSTLIIKIYTLFDAVLLTAAEEFLLVISSTEHINVSQLSSLEIGSHMAESSLMHRR